MVCILCFFCILRFLLYFMFLSLLSWRKQISMQEDAEQQLILRPICSIQRDALLKVSSSLVSLFIFSSSPSYILTNFIPNLPPKAFFLFPLLYQRKNNTAPLLLFWCCQHPGRAEVTLQWDIWGVCCHRWPSCRYLCQARSGSTCYECYGLPCTCGTILECCSSFGSVQEGRLRAAQHI